ncbi:hypothetical protein [Roseibium suaedae]|uniref:hypothetical protein n=1 Tax=Roseibium suaedae TaxID=735517 RepID=UPI001114D78D|nr:hypothetical protein [Roseibium suaedae]
MGKAFSFARKQTCRVPSLRKAKTGMCPRLPVQDLLHGKTGWCSAHLAGPFSGKFRKLPDFFQSLSRALGQNSIVKKAYLVTGAGLDGFAVALKKKRSLFENISTHWHFRAGRELS